MRSARLHGLAAAESTAGARRRQRRRRRRLGIGILHSAATGGSLDAAGVLSGRGRGALRAERQASVGARLAARQVSRRRLLRARSVHQVGRRGASDVQVAQRRRRRVPQPVRAAGVDVQGPLAAGRVRRRRALRAVCQPAQRHVVGGVRHRQVDDVRSGRRLGHQLGWRNGQSDAAPAAAVPLFGSADHRSVDAARVRHRRRALPEGVAGAVDDGVAARRLQWFNRSVRARRVHRLGGQLRAEDLRLARPRRGALPQHRHTASGQAGGAAHPGLLRRVREVRPLLLAPRRQLGISQGSCDDLHDCAPCTNPLTGQPTGAPGCP